MASGRRPIRYAVHGRLMTVQEVAKMAGVSRSAIEHHRDRHRYPDGTPLSLEETLDAYLRAREAGHRRVGSGGPQAKRYRLGRRDVTVKEAAAELGIGQTSVYRHLLQCGGDLETVRKKVEAKKTRKAEQMIMAIIKGD